MNARELFTRPIGRLKIDHEAVAECRELATTIARPLEELARDNTTLSIERASLRSIGVDGVEGEGADAVPIPNRVVDEVGASAGLDRGVLVPFLHAVEAGCGDIQTAADQIARREVVPLWPEGVDLEIALERARAEAGRAVDEIAAAARARAEVISRVGEAPKPWLYEIVATGNIHEDIPQAQAAAREGCDVVAVIR